MNIKNIKLITLDATNTILKFRTPPWKHYTAVVQDYGFKGSESNVKTYFNNSYKTMWKNYPNFGKSKLGWEVWWTEVVKGTFEGLLPETTNIEMIAKRLIDEFKTEKCWCVADDAVKLINLFHNNSIRLGVVSNFDPRLHDILKSVNLKHHFDFILTSYEAGYSKPDKQIFDIALSKCQWNLNPSQCLHIGDDLKKDFEGAKSAGWNAILIREILYSEIPPAPHYVFKSLKDLVKAVKNDKFIL